MIEVREVSKRFEGRAVLDRVSLLVPDRKVVVILGPSGIGKTVLLRVMTGLMVPDSGEVRYDGVTLRPDDGSASEAVLCRVGFVFQSGALFDSLTVAENIALPLSETRRLARAELERRVREALALVGMENCRDRYPHELSGGMSRLVAIARSLVTDPDYLFFDEPTTGLDPVMRERMTRLIVRLRDEKGKTGVAVTHDLESARDIADVVYMLRDGRLMLMERAGKESYETNCA
ncbi:ATP-binding cassette domain-containing protein [candidate division WOR-3 bacterium]|nr:ATP-binding cassette domain-containing protein [candidate division WOR-3 bacterium]